jgi:hypothetical protein
VAGNPNRGENERTAAYQMNRRRFSSTPGYHNVLPRVFPYRVKSSIEFANQLINFLTEVHRDGFALTSHPKSDDGHVHLWMSSENAEYLEQFGEITSSMLERTGGE